MADHYPATLVMSARIADLPKPVLDVIQEAFGADLRESIGGGSFQDYSEPGSDLAQKDKRGSVLEIYEARYGIYNFTDTGVDDGEGGTVSLLDLLQEHGITYEASDEGLYENPGERAWWKPGMDGPRTTENTPSGAVLTQQDYGRMAHQAESTRELVALVNDHFAGPWD
jgi:hypothetical protein